jgi:hypothetical protein
MTMLSRKPLFDIWPAVIDQKPISERISARSAHRRLISERFSADFEH